VTSDVTGSVVLITGGGSGVGPAITRELLHAGATVAISGRRRD
jgi:meso-butanediol dehydrogenase / (S,S)-butanediol dehydrogenase / diacetyl reductase